MNFRSQDIVPFRSIYTTSTLRIFSIEKFSQSQSFGHKVHISASTKPEAQR